MPHVRPDGDSNNDTWHALANVCTPPLRLLFIGRRIGVVISGGAITIDLTTSTSINSIS